jgi:hypothetical protein
MDTTDRIAVRDARHDEAQFIVQMIRHMVEDMATYGGYAPATEHEAWQTLSVAIAAELRGQNSKYVIAEAPSGDRIGATDLRWRLCT